MVGQNLDIGSTVLFLLVLVGSFQAVIMGYIPVEYAALATALFGVLSEVTAILRRREEVEKAAA